MFQASAGVSVAAAAFDFAPAGRFAAAGFAACAAGGAVALDAAAGFGAAFPAGSDAFAAAGGAALAPPACATGFGATGFGLDFGGAAVGFAGFAAFAVAFGGVLAAGFTAVAALRDSIFLAAAAFAGACFAFADFDAALAEALEPVVLGRAFPAGPDLEAAAGLFALPGFGFAAGAEARARAGRAGLVAFAGLPATFFAFTSRSATRDSLLGAGALPAVGPTDGVARDPACTSVPPVGATCSAPPS